MKTFFLGLLLLGLTINLYSGLPEVDERLVGNWKFDMEHPMLDSLEEKDEFFMTMILKDFTISFSNDNLVALELNAKRESGTYQTSPVGGLFMMMDKGAYTMSSYEMDTDGRMVLSRRDVSMEVPLKRISDKNVNLLDKSDGYKRLEVPIKKLEGKSLRIQELDLNGNKASEYLKEDSAIIMHGDNTRSIIVDGNESKDMWQYDAGSRTLYWGDREMGVYLHLVEDNYPKLKFRSGVEGPIVMVNVE